MFSLCLFDSKSLSGEGDEMLLLFIFQYAALEADSALTDYEPNTV